MDGDCTQTTDGKTKEDASAWLSASISCLYDGMRVATNPTIQLRSRINQTETPLDI